jgi:hypothetical protein
MHHRMANHAKAAEQNFALVLGTQYLSLEAKKIVIPAKAGLENLVSDPVDLGIGNGGLSAEAKATVSIPGKSPARTFVDLAIEVPATKPVGLNVCQPCIADFAFYGDLHLAGGSTLNEKLHSRHGTVIKRPPARQPDRGKVSIRTLPVSEFTFPDYDWIAFIDTNRSDE